MLVLTRYESEKLHIGDDVEITILEVNGQVKIGIKAPEEITILREELCEQD